ncbi:MAG: leucine-rich repeat domain-containing protein [Bacteroidales bacterium]|nr:leucine-rich repeat domain-containing protein [Bacteroidales bacterium]
MRKVFLLAAMVVCAACGWAQGDFSQRCRSGQLLHYKLLADSCSVVVTHAAAEWPYYTDSRPAGVVEIPAEVVSGGRVYKVAGVGECAFYRCDGLAGVVLPEGCTSVGAQAFCGCAALDTLVLPSSLSAVGEGAFAYCRSLRVLRLPAAVARPGLSAFACCTGLREVSMAGEAWCRRGVYLFFGVDWLEDAKCRANLADGTVLLRRDDKRR